MENRDYIVAIDLGSNTVVTVVGTREDDGKIRIVDSEISAVQGMLRGEIKNIEFVAKSIKDTVDAIEGRLGIKIKEAYAGISGQHIRSVKHPYYVFVGRDGEIREEDVQKLHDSMRNVQAPDGETIIQIIPQNYIIDDEEETSNPVGAFGKKLAATFSVIMGDSTAVKRIERAFARTEIGLGGMFLNAVASAEAVASEDEKEEGVAVVDIGGGTTDVTIIQKNIVRHVAVIPMGGNLINKDIRSYGILERHVENLKVKYGSAMRDKVQSEKFITTPGLNARVPKEISFQNLAAIIEARMLDIIDFVKEEIKNSGYEDRLGAGVVLTGGCAQLKDLDALFKSYTGIDVRIATPDVKLTEECLELVNNPALATAVGLLLKGCECGSTRTANRPVASIRQPMRNPFAEPETESNPFAVNDPLGRRTINELYNNDPKKTEDHSGQDDGDGGVNGGVNGYGYDEEPKDQKKKGGLFSKLKHKIDTMFDVIEDNEI